MPPIFNGEKDSDIEAWECFRRGHHFWRPCGFYRECTWCGEREREKSAPN